MLRKVVLGIMLILLITSVALSYTVRVQPDKIVPASANGMADTIQVSVIISVAEVKDLTASISIAGGDSIDNIDFYYCATDDVLHIYFDKDEVIDNLDGLDGEVVVDLTASFTNGDSPVEIEGSDILEVFNPASSAK